jgi:isoleucyl-tRNA synthetase
MDYKNTLNLPRTDFAMKADLVAREPQRLAAWQTGNLYARIESARATAPRFILHDGPLFSNGDLHIGNALNKILKDIIVRYKSLRGFHAPMVPGWDCHGLPVEFKVTQEMRKRGDTSTDPVALRQACEAYARKFIDIQREQWQRLGAVGDWAHPYLTLDRAYEADELRLFADIVEKGFVYRGKKPVYWSIPCRTALAEAEVEYQDHVSQSVFVKFPVVDRPGTFILIWTTTPWTLPANLAVAYNSTFSYSLVRVSVDDERTEDYLVSALLLNPVAAKCGWKNFTIIRSLDAGQLTEVRYQHPFCQRTGRLYPGDQFVDNTTGTGFVHIAPGHGLEDFGLGLERGLPIYSPVDDDGRFIHTDDLPAVQQMPRELIGKSILEKHGQSEANEAVLHELRVRHALAHQENYHHSYPHCWRSKTPVIFRAMDQWFIRIDHPSDGSSAPARTFRQQALEEIQRVHWIPDWGRGRIESAVASRPDWCISRQRAWGVPIPAFYDSEGNPILDAQIVRRTADLVGQHGSNVWFEKTAADLWALLRPENWKGPEAAAKSSDTLDVWIDSGSSSRAVLMRRPELQSRTGVSPVRAETPPTAGGTPALPWQADMYLEGSDQHRGWFQSSLLLSLAGNGVAPFKIVLTHGFMVDADREKISKSKQGQGGYEKPQTAEAYIKKYGADVVRLWVASQDFRNDVIVSDERISTVGETYRVIRNALRYQLSNLYDFDPANHTVPDHQLTGLDRWILGEFAKLEAAVVTAYDAYEFHVVYQKLSQFVAVELSAVYHDVVKDRLYTDPANSARRRSTQTTLYRLVNGLCQMLAPILAFTADEAWEFVPARSGRSVHEWTWQPMGLTPSEAEQATWAALLALREQALPELEKARQGKQIGKALEASVRFAGRDPRLQSVNAPQRPLLAELLNVSQLDLAFAAEAEPALRISVARAEGQKCERCWHWETDVGRDSAHPTLCGRCVEAVKPLAGS